MLVPSASLARPESVPALSFPTEVPALAVLGPVVVTVAGPDPDMNPVAADPASTAHPADTTSTSIRR
jgi:hypothetical protein